MKTLLGILVALAIAPSAQAKVCVKIDTSEPLQVGRPATITLTTMLPVFADGKLVSLKPYADGIVAMSMFVKPRLGARVLLQLKRDAVDRSRWRARFVFRRAGEWTLRSATIPVGVARACSGMKRVVVRRG